MGVPSAVGGRGLSVRLGDLDPEAQSIPGGSSMRCFIVPQSAGSRIVKSGFGAKQLSGYIVYGDNKGGGHEERV